MNTTRLNKFVFAAVLLSSLAAVLPAQAHVQARSNVAMSADDAALASQVKAALLQAQPFKDADVDITVAASNGQVELSGWVTYANDPQAAARIASSVSGVKAVTTSLRTWSADDDYRV